MRKAYRAATSATKILLSSSMLPWQRSQEAKSPKDDYIHLYIFLCPAAMSGISKCSKMGDESGIKLIFMSSRSS
jgi:hypothetical protein